MAEKTETQVRNWLEGTCLGMGGAAFSPRRPGSRTHAVVSVCIHVTGEIVPESQEHKLHEVIDILC